MKTMSDFKTRLLAQDPATPAASAQNCGIKLAPSTANHSPQILAPKIVRLSAPEELEIRRAKNQIVQLPYDGTPYQGWQKQPGRSTIQGTLETALTQIYNEPIRTMGSGRTDAGVHAVGQVAHFETDKILNNEARLIRGLNSLLPDSIVTRGIWVAPDDFHALASAKRKTYIYRIWNHPIRSALWHQRALWVPQPIDMAHLNKLSKVIVGRRDFKSFSRARAHPSKRPYATWTFVSGSNAAKT